MPKVKIKRHIPLIDMTAMCDVAFLLLTFFMLTSNFTRKEAVTVATPSSISEIKIPERNMLMILVNKQGQLFFGIDGQENRKSLLERMGAAYNISFDEKELKDFSLVNSFGLPVSRLKTWLLLNPEERENAEFNTGIPGDSIDNQLKKWVAFAKSINPEYRIAIKADQATPYPVIRKLMATLQELKENRYNLITSLETTGDLETTN